ncbi:MAG: exodeoxyribonuclease III, partial [Ruthenibacterium sp.]
DEERENLTQLLDAGFADTFRTLHPTEIGAYSWWSYFRNARATNAGWRIDYFIISKRLCETLDTAFICADVLGSDHCPVGITLCI